VAAWRFLIHRPDWTAAFIWSAPARHLSLPTLRISDNAVGGLPPRLRYLSTSCHAAPLTTIPTGNPSLHFVHARSCTHATHDRCTGGRWNYYARHCRPSVRRWTGLANRPNNAFLSLASKLHGSQLGTTTFTATAILCTIERCNTRTMQRTRATGRHHPHRARATGGRATPTSFQQRRAAAAFTLLPSTMPYLWGSGLARAMRTPLYPPDVSDDNQYFGETFEPSSHLVCRRNRDTVSL